MIVPFAVWLLVGIIENILFDIQNMPLHCRSRRRAVPGLQGVDDAQMPFHRGRAAAVALQPGRATFVDDRLDGGHHAADHPIAGALRQELMKVGVPPVLGTARHQGALLIADHNLELIQGGTVNTPRRQRGDLRLDHLPKLDNFAEDITAVIEDGDDGVHGLIRIEAGQQIGTIPLSAFDNVAFGQGLEGLAQLATGNSKPLRQAAFRWQAIPRHQFPGNDHGADTLNNGAVRCLFLRFVSGLH